VNRQIRRVAIGMVVLFGALFINLNVIQVVQSNSLRDDSRNARGLLQEYEIARGSIVVGQRADGKAIARSQDTGGRLRYMREYPEGPRYAHVTGFYSFVYGRTEVEQAYNDFLVGSAPEVFARNLADLLAGRERVGDIVQLTIDPAAQEAAEAGLDGSTGAVVALDPQTGAILALYSSPSYDPSPLAEHDGSVVRSAWEELGADDANPRLNRAIRETYPPGSTFKVVTAAAALESGVRPSTMYPDPDELELPLTSATIRNFDGGSCADGDEISLEEAFEVSCNTTFGQIGLDLGGERLVSQAERFGVNQAPEFDLPNVAVSRFPGDDLDEPATAQSAIGQRDVAVTPLQMAMISAAIANDGQVMTPRLVRHVENTTGRILRQYGEEPWRISGSAQAVSVETARALRNMMVAAVDDGTGTNAQISGVEVAGKTGTAQTGEDRPPTVWFTGFAPANDPQVAVAVVIAGGDEDATGGRVAAPIARDVMAAVLGES
jgi:penicillin-binding protein A